jgi:sigma-E factor negative regulatory protein RseC
MKERAEVVKTYKNTATVKIDRKSECSSCKMCAFKSGTNFVKVRAKNDINAKVGDAVIIDLEKDNRLTASFLIYIVPLIFAAAGLLIGNFLGNEILMFGLCLFMLVLGYIIIALIDKKLSDKKGFSPEIVQILSKEKNIDE